MLFSLIIPVYNTEKYLQECLDSVAAQDFDDFEVILVDDGSTDGCPAICDRFCEQFNGRVGRKSTAKVIHQKNAGLSGARNRGISEASGEWLWFVDSDDWIPSDALDVLHERMRYAKGEQYVFEYIKTDANRQNEERVYFRVEQEAYRLPDENALLSHLADRLFDYRDGWEAPTRLYRRDIVLSNDLRFYETEFNFGEDLCFAAEYSLCIRSTVMLVNYLYYYRQQNSSIMHTLDQKTILPRLTILLEHVFREAVRLKKNIVSSNFDKICLSSFGNHIKNKLNELSDEEVRSEILDAAKNPVIGKYISAVSSQLEQVLPERRKG